MFLTLCQELRELFQDDDLELTFSEDDDFSEDEECASSIKSSVQDLKCWAIRKIVPDWHNFRL